MAQHKHRVLLADTSFWFERALDRILKQADDLSVLRVRCDDERALGRVAGRWQPQVIVLSANGVLDPSRALAVLGELRALTFCRLIVIRLDANLVLLFEHLKMNIRDSQSLPITRLEDLVDVIRGSSPVPRLGHRST